MTTYSARVLIRVPDQSKAHPDDIKKVISVALDSCESELLKDFKVDTAIGSQGLEQKAFESWIGPTEQRCPCCGSNQVCGGSIEISEDIAHQNVTCDICGADWNELYLGAGVEHVNKGDDLAVPLEDEDGNTSR